MGMMDWVEDDEDGSSAGDTDEETIDEMDEMEDMNDFDDFDDDFDDDLDDGFDDDFQEASSGSGDDGNDFDDFDDFDDDFGDDGGGGGGGGSAASTEQLADFEDRIGELETQVGSISSTMNTVREENKQIGETVDELDDTIRKLLDIYEMVTRGINPFVDDAKEMGGLEHGDGAFGLFDSEEEEEEDLSSDVANADAEDFFDEDFGDLDPDQQEERAEAAAGENLTDEETDGPEMLEPEPEPQPEPETSDADSGGGVSFDDLKAEYDDDGWDDGVEPDADPAAADEREGTDDAEAGAPDIDVDAAEADDEASDADHADDSEPDSDGETDTEAEETVDDTMSEETVDDPDDTLADGEDEVDAEPEPEVEADVDSEQVDDAEADSEADTDQSETAAPDTPRPDGTASSGAEPTVGPAEAKTDEKMFEPDAGADRPPTSAPEPAGDTPQHEPAGRERHGVPRADDSPAHLSQLPPTYVAESVAMEWMRFLVSTGGLLGASRALRQYEDFGWISAEVRATLDTYARLAATPGDNGSHGQLSVEHHETSLSYVSRLGDRTPDAGAMNVLAADGGTSDGIRR